jgi:hypothetical protein
MNILQRLKIFFFGERKRLIEEFNDIVEQTKHQTVEKTVEDVKEIVEEVKKVRKPRKKKEAK